MTAESDQARRDQRRAADTTRKARLAAARTAARKK